MERVFGAMLPKNAISRAEFVRLLNAKEDGDSLSIKSMTSSSIPEYLLTQLFLNALTSPVDEMYPLIICLGNYYVFDLQVNKVRRILFGYAVP